MKKNLKELLDLLGQDIFTDAPEYSARVERARELALKIAKAAARKPNYTEALYILHKAGRAPKRRTS